jgi:hypothetical protein
MTAPQVESPSKCPIAVLNQIQRLRDVLADCREIEFIDLSDVPDHMLREATNHFSEIKELVDSFYGPIAFQIEDNEMAELEADTAADLVTPTPPGDQDGENTDGLELEDKQLNGAACSRQDAAGHLADAYSSLFRRIRNRDRESPGDAKYREQHFQAFDAIVKSMVAEDQAYLSRLEDSYRGHARKIHQKVAARLRFWGLPETACPERVAG